MNDINNITFSIGDVMAVLAIIASLYAFVKMWRDIKKPMQERNSKIDTLLENHDKKINEDYKRLENIDSSLTSILEKLDSTNKKIDMISSCLRDFSRQILLNECTNCLSQGFATLEQKETIDKLFKSYTSLGGNSFISAHVKQVMELPTKIHDKILTE